MALKITIITPSFNQGAYLEQTIDSVLSQNYQNLEYIIIDGGSTDNSPSIIKKYEKHLAYWISEKDRGQSHAINKGLQRATGEIVNWLNSDDYYEQDALKIVSSAFADPATNALLARSNIIRKEKIIQQSSGTDVYAGNLAKTIGWARIDQPETFFRRASYQQIGLLNESLHYVMDREWWIRYLFHFGLSGIKKIDYNVVNFRHHDNSKTETRKDAFIEENIFLFWSLAKQYGLELQQDLMHKMFFKPRHLEPLIFKNVDSALVTTAMNYFLLLKADECYFQLKLKDAQKILQEIDITLFQEEDKKLFKKLYFRARFIPSFILKALR